MAFADRKKRARAKPVMNVTPLVDVVLVLLIIFMVVLPAMDEQVRVDIPSIIGADDREGDQTSEENSYTLAITAAGALYLDTDPVNPAQLESALRSAHHRAPRKKLILRGDRTLGYASVRRVFATAQTIGFPGVMLRVNQRQGADAPAAGG